MERNMCVGPHLHLRRGVDALVLLVELEQRLAALVHHGEDRLQVGLLERFLLLHHVVERHAEALGPLLPLRQRPLRGAVVRDKGLTGAAPNHVCILFTI